MTRYPLCRRLGGSHGRSGQMRKISPPLGFDLQTVQFVASRYTDWAVPARKYWPYADSNCIMRTGLRFIVSCLHRHRSLDDLGGGTSVILWQMTQKTDLHQQGIEGLEWQPPGLRIIRNSKNDPLDRDRITTEFQLTSIRIENLLFVNWI